VEEGAMSLPGRWSFWLVSISDMRNIAPLSSSSGTPSGMRLRGLGRNMTGRFEASLPMRSEAAILAQPHSTAIRADRLPAAGGGAVTRWSGFVQSINTDLSSERTTITAIGWFEELNNRLIRMDEAASGRLNFVDEIGGEIARELLRMANEQTDSDLNPRPTHLRMGSRTDTQRRTISFQHGTTYGAAIDGLSQIENGFDWTVDPLQRTLDICGPDEYEQVDAHLVHGINCSVSVSEDGARRRNRITITGAGGIVESVDDPEAIAAAGGQIIDEQANLSSIADSSILQAYGVAEIAFLANAPIILSVRPRSLGNVPRLYDDFNYGDQMFLTARGGRVNLDRQPVRPFSVDMSFSEQGDEIIDEMTVALS
jgi:hypothetical protein